MSWPFPAVCLEVSFAEEMCDHQCRLIKAIHRERDMGHPLKMMIKDLGIAQHSLNSSSFDWPVRQNRVIQHASAFHTPTDHEVNPMRSRVQTGVAQCIVSVTMLGQSSDHEMLIELYLTDSSLEVSLLQIKSCCLCEHCLGATSYSMRQCLGKYAA